MNNTHMEDWSKSTALNALASWRVTVTPLPPLAPSAEVVSSLQGEQVQSKRHLLA